MNGFKKSYRPPSTTSVSPWFQPTRFFLENLPAAFGFEIVCNQRTFWNQTEMSIAQKKAITHAGSTHVSIWFALESLDNFGTHRLIHFQIACQAGKHETNGSQTLRQFWNIVHIWSRSTRVYQPIQWEKPTCTHTFNVEIQKSIPIRHLQSSIVVQA